MTLPPNDPEAHRASARAAGIPERSLDYAVKLAQTFEKLKDSVRDDVEVTLTSDEAKGIIDTVVVLRQDVAAARKKAGHQP